MKILVTGAAGFIGSHTVDQLLRKGQEVVGVDNFSTGRIENLAEAKTYEHFSFRHLDLTKGKDVWDNLLSREKPEAILHLAALVSVQESIEFPDKNFIFNIQMTHNLLEAAKRFDVRRIVFASSAAVYGNNPIIPLVEEKCPPSPLSPYGAAKLAGEGLLESYNRCYGIETISFRYFNVFGARQDPSSPYSGVISIFKERISKGHSITVFGNGEQTRDFVYVKDVARLNTMAITSRNVVSGKFNLCTGEESSLNQLIDCLKELYDSEPQIRYKAARSGDIRRSLGSPVKLEKYFNSKPKFSLHSGVSDWLECK